MHLLVGFFFSYLCAAELRTSVRAFAAISNHYRFQATKRNILVTPVNQTRNSQCLTGILYMNVLSHTVIPDDIYIALGKTCLTLIPNVQRKAIPVRAMKTYGTM
jgi:hypothetical protein